MSCHRITLCLQCLSQHVCSHCGGSLWLFHQCCCHACSANSYGSQAVSACMSLCRSTQTGCYSRRCFCCTQWRAWPRCATRCIPISKAGHWPVTCSLHTQGPSSRDACPQCGNVGMPCFHLGMGKPAEDQNGTLWQLCVPLGCGGIAAHVVILQAAHVGGHICLTCLDDLRILAAVSKRSPLHAQSHSQHCLRGLTWHALSNTLTSARWPGASCSMLCGRIRRA